ncbi:hypothetical protein ACUXG4_001271, partial [Cupriavidus metallidurans]
CTAPALSCLSSHLSLLQFNLSKGFVLRGQAQYGDEVSNLRIGKVVGEFLLKHVRNFLKRVFYNYYLRDLSIASLELPLGFMMLAFGVTFGALEWVRSLNEHTPASAGTVMLAGLPVIVGLQFLLAFLSYDIGSVPRRPLHRSKLRQKAFRESNGGVDEKRR